MTMETGPDASGGIHLPKRLEWVPAVLPGVLVAVILTTYPSYSLIKTSLFNWTDDGFAFVGLQNFVDLMGRPRTPLYLWNTTIWTMMTTLGALFLGIVAALALQARGVVAKGLIRSLLLLPWIVPQVAAAVVWKWFYSTEFGMLNHMLQSAGLASGPINWLTDPALALPATAMLQIWATFPFVMLMVSAGLQTVDESQLEAARIDGASPWGELVHVVLPSLKGVLFIVTLIIVVWALNSFTFIWLLTQGGPAGTTSILPIYVYVSFRDFDLPASAAASVLLLAVSLLFAAIYVWRVAREEAS